MIKFLNHIFSIFKWWNTLEETQNISACIHQQSESLISLCDQKYSDIIDISQKELNI